MPPLLLPSTLLLAIIFILFCCCCCCHIACCCLLHATLLLFIMLRRRGRSVVVEEKGCGEKGVVFVVGDSGRHFHDVYTCVHACHIIITRENCTADIPRGERNPPCSSIEHWARRLVPRDIFLLAVYARYPPNP